MTELNELERKAEEARQAADKANRELETLWNEYQRLPGKAERITTKLASLKADRESLDVEKLNAQFRDFYRAILEGALVDRMALVFHSGTIATRDLRLEVIRQLETKLEAELAELRKRNKELCKRLGRKPEI